MARAWVGTSGYDYNHWRDAFYPPELPRAERLPFYARHFDTVEINNSFYQLPSPTTLAKWRDAVAGNPRFRFVLKGHQYLTHRKKLNEPRREPIESMFAVAEALGDRCVGILWQFPGNWRVNAERLQAFVDDLRALQRGGWWHAFEFRHGTWMHEPVFDILRKADMGIVLTDMPFQTIVPGDLDARPEIPRPVVTAPLTSRVVYVRRHGPEGGFGGGYTPEQTAADAAAIRAWVAEGREVYAFFNNDPWAHAVRDAARLAGLAEDRERPRLREAAGGTWFT